jgi:hypothetical protein
VQVARRVLHKRLRTQPKVPRRRATEPFADAKRGFSRHLDQFHKAEREEKEA